MAITPRSFCGAHSPAYMMWIFRPKPAATNGCEMGQYKLLSVWCFGGARHIGLGSQMYFYRAEYGSASHEMCSQHLGIASLLRISLCKYVLLGSRYFLRLAFSYHGSSRHRNRIAVAPFNPRLDVSVYSGSLVFYFMLETNKLT